MGEEASRQSAPQQSIKPTLQHELYLIFTSPDFTLVGMKCGLQGCMHVPG